MTTIRRFHPNDMFRFNNINFDELTETYNLPYYMQYMACWPAFFVVAETPGDNVAGYLMGKAEGVGDQWHGHVSAVTVAAEYRRLGLAQVFMGYTEQLSEQYRGHFVDLYVRVSNSVAVAMYRKFGYIPYRQVIGYYSGEEDAYDMRKALSRDPNRKSMVPLPKPVHPGEND